MSEPTSFDAVLARWNNVRARSQVGASYCVDCYYSFTLGVRHQDGGGYPCPKHATDEEKREVEAKLGEALKGLDDHPLMKMVRRDRT